ncbi:exported hypothetical protein [Gammaproteobacteria bacterium]
MKAMIPILAASFLTLSFGGTSSAADSQEQQQEILKKDVRCRTECFLFCRYYFSRRWKIFSHQSYYLIV